MAAEKTEARNARLAAALKENLKRRKAEHRRAADEPDGELAAATPHSLGTAPQAGLEAKPEHGPKSASKRR